MSHDSQNTPLGEQVTHQIQDEERCPQCNHDFALCRCYDEVEEDDSVEDTNVEDSYAR